MTVVSFRRTRITEVSEKYERVEIAEVSPKFGGNGPFDH